MQIVFWTDPHLGIKRASHTTVQSQEMLRTFLYVEVKAMIDRIRLACLGEYPAKRGGLKFVCAGDLFDMFSNKEEILDQGSDIAKECDFILAGNHDLRNNSEVMSSLQFLKKQIETDEENSVTRFIISPTPAEGYYQQEWLDKENKVDITFVPHCFTQGAFEGSIRAAAEARDPDCFSILCLHCNVGEVYGAAENDSSTLVLTQELQDVVADFGLVLVGHEHTPKRTKNIQILGNFFPVSFGEIGDRFIWWFDTVTKELTKELIFSADDQYVEIPVTDIIECGGEMSVYQRMVQITGQIDAKEYPDLSRALLKFWKENGETLFAVRNSVEVQRPNEVKKKSGSKQTLPEYVQAASKTAGFEKEFEELSALVETDND